MVSAADSESSSADRKDFLLGWGGGGEGEREREISKVMDEP